VSPEPKSSAPVPQPFDEAEGVTLPASPDGRPGFLSDVIIELGLASKEVVDDAVGESRLVGKMPEEIMVESGAITDEQLAIAVAERNGLPYVDLFKFKVDEGAARLIDPDTARRYRALPIASDAGGALVVALPDPMDALAVSDIGVVTKSEVRTAVCSDAGMEALLATLPASKRSARLSAHGPDGFAGARAAESGEWSLAKSISTPEPESPPAVMPDPMLEPAQVQAPAAPAAQPEDLDSRIEELVAKALEKRLEPSPGSGDGSELERANEQLTQTRAELEGARAEIEALNARIEELEAGAKPSKARPKAPASAVS
jgi:hypothetical protein